MLKQLIQWLLDSRTTPAQAAHSALRNTSSSTSIFTGEQIYTAPEDGFITVEGKSEANGGSAIGISSNGENYFLRTFQSVKDWGQAVTAPVSKGETVSISLYNLTDIEVKFYKSFGGGYNILVRRALSCLRPSFNYLPRSFCKAKNSGLAVKHSLKQLLHWMFRHVPSLHRLMGILDTSILSAVEANSCSIWIRVKKYLAVKSLVIAGFLQQTPTARQQYLSRKAVLLLLLPTRCSIKFGLLRLQARHNLRTGGALC